MRRFIALLVPIALTFGAPSVRADENPPGVASVANVTQKGSLLVWPEIVIRWNFQGNLISDTYINLANDLLSSGVRVKFYFVNGDAPAAPVFIGDPPIILVERAHPGCNYFDNLIELTHDEPTYFSALTGLPGGVSSFIILDYGSGNPMDPIIANRPGRPDDDPNNPGGRVMRGFLLGFAIDNFGNLIRHNHLTGGATVIDYRANSAYSTNAFRFKAQYFGTLASDTLLLNGTVYDACPQYLLLEFFATGSTAFGANLSAQPSSVSTRLTLLPMVHDFSPTRPLEPIPTDAQFDVWNADEVKLTNLHRCIRCWDSTLLGNYGVPNYFLFTNLGSQRGKARVAGLANPLCDRPGDPNASPPVPSLNSASMPLLGNAERIIQWSSTRIGRGGMELSGLGTRTDGYIKFVRQTDPPELNNP